MKDKDWVNQSDPTKMLKVVQSRASDRKFLLFACACCRRILDAISDERSRQAIEVAERYADGLATVEELRAAGHAARMASRAGLDAAAAATLLSSCNAFDAAWALVDPRQMWYDAFWGAAYYQPRGSEGSFAYFRGNPSREGQPGLVAQRKIKAEREAQANLLREILGNPSRLPRFDPTWLVANDGVVVRLATAIYTDRTFAHLPILGDALEEAGCLSSEILGHLRAGGKHVRGCWVLDLLLGKE